MPKLWNYKTQSVEDVTGSELKERGSEFVPANEQDRFDSMVEDYKDDPIMALFLVLEEVFAAS